MILCHFVYIQHHVYCSNEVWYNGNLHCMETQCEGRKTNYAFKPIKSKTHLKPHSLGRVALNGFSGFGFSTLMSQFLHHISKTMW